MDNRNALVPTQDLWHRVRAGLVNETDVDSYGRLLRSIQRDYTRTERMIINRYEYTIKKIDAQTPPTINVAPSREKKKRKVEEILQRLSELERQVSALISSLRMANITVINIYDSS
jgi:hypothetical protein